MASTTTLCNSFKDELAKGIHDFTTDVLKVALFPSVAALTAAVTAYGATDAAGKAIAANEVGGANDPNAGSVSNYTAGGRTLGAATLTAAAANVSNPNVAAWDWPDAVFPSTGTACTVVNVAYALIYNSTKQNRAIMFCTYSPTLSATSATFTVTIPETGTGALRIG